MYWSSMLMMLRLHWLSLVLLSVLDVRTCRSDHVGGGDCLLGADHRLELPRVDVDTPLAHDWLRPTACFWRGLLHKRLLLLLLLKSLLLLLLLLLLLKSLLLLLLDLLLVLKLL